MATAGSTEFPPVLDPSPMAAPEKALCLSLRTGDLLPHAPGSSVQCSGCLTPCQPPHPHTYTMQVTGTFQRPPL